jgi:serine/threonine-protein kinase
MAKLPAIWTLCLSAVVFAVPILAQSEGWSVYYDHQYGCQLEYPSFVFAADQREPDDPHSFSGPNHETYFRILGVDNPSGRTPADIKAEYVRSNIPGEITYERTKREFLVLSGYRGDSIFYTKVSLSKDGKIACILEITYPRNDKTKFDTIVTRMSRSFAHRTNERLFSECEKVIRAPARYQRETVELCEIVTSL